MACRINLMAHRGTTCPKENRTSSMSSETQSGIGVPQYRFREIFQSRALASQLPNRPSPTLWGTLSNDEVLAHRAGQPWMDASTDHLVFALLSTS